jgi:hypothetical protein
MSDFVSTEMDGYVAVITIENPPSKTALREQFAQQPAETA